MIQFSLLFLLLTFANDAKPTTAIKVDQAGYLPAASKVAFVVAPAPATEFKLRSAKNGSIVYSGKLTSVQADADSGDQVQAADFSDFRKSGSFFIDVPGVGRSWNFKIDSQVYARPFYLAIRSFYGQRCGTAVDLGKEFPGYRYQACHTEGLYHPSSGKTGPAPSVKGWHDAGDYGRYIVNSGITTGTLLWAFEMYADRVKEIKLDIPESGNKTPDMLDEIRWNLEWMLSMQDSDGGVWHKQTTEKFSGFVMPEADKAPSQVIGTGTQQFKGACATADFAAVMAIAARVYRPYDPGFATKCVQASRNAFGWVEANPTVLFRNPVGVNTGAYGDRSAADEMLWAAAELWRTTWDERFHSYFMAHFGEFRNTLRHEGPPAWASVAPFGLWSYVLASKNDAATAAMIKDDIVKAADQIVERTARHPYRISMTTKDFIWGSNSVAANYSVQLLVANAVRPNPAYVQAALDNLHYLLGRNTFSLSWVTQVGENPYRHPHHRPSGADSNPEPWPGLLSGGPNRSKQDDAMRKLPDLPPARMYVDEEASYASNEIAINWNSPLVFILAGALPEGKK